MTDGKASMEVGSITDAIDDNYAHVMVLATARRHGHGPQRLPDRVDRGRRVAAVQVESDDEACLILTSLDRPGRHFYIDVERKQDLNLIRVATSSVSEGHVHTIKPNDITVDAFEAVITHRFGLDLSDLPVAIYGTGNLALKFALRMAERSASVALVGRNSQKAAAICSAINGSLPHFSRSRVHPELPADGIRVLASAVTAEHVIDPSWIGILSRDALCIDVGINNFAPQFIFEANSSGRTCTRLDVRSASDPLPAVPNPFFDEIAGCRDLNGHIIVAGGHLGRLGEVVVDQLKQPTRVIGIANGTGGLVPADDWSDEFTVAVDAIKQAISGSA